MDGLLSLPKARNSKKYRLSPTSDSGSGSGSGSGSDKSPCISREASMEDVSDRHRHISTPTSSGGSSSPTTTTATRKKIVLDHRVDYTEFNVHIVTWNIASKEPSSKDVESLFLPQQGCMFPDILETTDILVIGLQEAYQSVQDAVQSSVPLVGKDTLMELFCGVFCKKGFARLSASRLLGIFTMVFVKRPLLCYIRGVDVCTVKTGVSGWLGNKGSSTIRFSLCDVSVCLVNCHLIPHPENNSRRVQELSTIFSSLSFSVPPLQTMQHDIVVLFGDLNFRLEDMSLEEVVGVLASEGGKKNLLRSDQLHLEQIRGEESPCKLFNFMEMPLNFLPSYKFEPGTDSYNGGEKRRAPAWCDRILWRTHERRLPLITDPDPRPVLTQQHYSMHMQPRISDHKAVSAGLTVSVNLDGFIPRVIFNVMTEEWVAGEAGSIAFEMVAEVEVSVWDWIGLYPENFANVEKDYVYWIYTPVKGGRATRGREYVRRLTPDQVPVDPGRYILLYKSNHLGCVLGMSPVFPISDGHS